MIFTGMIYQYDAEQGFGLIMLADAQTKEFSLSQWSDSDCFPEVGLKIVYESDGTEVKIRVHSEEDVNTTEEKNISLEENMESLISLGFKLVKEMKEGEMKTVLLRSFAQGESEEVVITQKGSITTLLKTINGKRVE